eukprot:CAMPEP_0117454794 /NCGR_PEP_ID=MMETSP0759-20121206/10999_1 /TAXON_ID=63605 /ORGANISM="Percolomonas cosmopolitus, Strain WS" /LENGTH=861 /DNA_ID=CAMNT_0005248021 /DNA_START=887 /DNA_END=3472 /DNA_ORIENTATION=-
MKSLDYYEAPIRILSKRPKINYLSTEQRKWTQRRQKEGKHNKEHAIFEDEQWMQQDPPANSGMAQQAQYDQSLHQIIHSPTKGTFNAQRKKLHYHQSTTYRNSQKERYRMYNKMEELGVIQQQNNDGEYSSAAFGISRQASPTKLSRKKRLNRLKMEKKHYSDVEKYFLPLVKSNRRRDISMRASSGQNESDIEWIMEKRRIEDSMDEEEAAMHIASTNAGNAGASSSTTKHLQHSSIADVYNDIPELTVSPTNRQPQQQNLSGLLVKEYFKQEYGNENFLLSNSQSVEYNLAVTSSSDQNDNLLLEHTTTTNTRRGSHTSMQSQMSVETVPPVSSLSSNKERLKVIDMDDLLEGNSMSTTPTARPRVNPWGSFRDTNNHKSDSFSHTPGAPNGTTPTSMINTIRGAGPQLSLLPKSEPLPTVSASSEYTSSVNWNDACLFNLCRPLYLQPSVYYRVPQRITPNDIVSTQILYALNWGARHEHGSSNSTTTSSPTSSIPFPSDQYLPNLKTYLLGVRQYYTHELKTNAESLPIEQQMQDIPRNVKREVLKQYSDEKLKAEVFRRSKRYAEQCLCLYNSCILLDNIRMHEKSSVLCAQILDRSQKINDRVMECMVLNHLCLNYMMQYMKSREESVWHNALRYGEMHLEFTDVNGKSIAHANLGLLYLLAHVHGLGGDGNDVEGEMTEKNPQIPSNGQSAQQSRFVSNFIREEALPMCLDHYTKGLVMSYSAKQPRVQQSVLSNFALALSYGGHNSEALDLLQRLLLIDSSHLNKMITYILCGHIAQKLKNPNDAYKYYQEASKEGKYTNNALVKELTHLAQTHMTQTKANLLYESQMQAFRELSEGGGGARVSRIDQVGEVT